MKITDIDLMVPHQANQRILDALARRLGMPEERIMVNVQRYGNTSAGTIPVALTEALEEGRIKPGDYVLMASFGAGLTWGAALVRWGSGSPHLPSAMPNCPPASTRRWRFWPPISPATRRTWKSETRPDTGLQGN